MSVRLKKLDEHIKSATVMVCNAHNETRGTGFFVLPDVVVTCLHVVNNASNAVILVHDDGTAINGEPLNEENFQVDTEHDIALINLPDAYVRSEQPCLYLRESGQRRDAYCAYGYGAKKNLDKGSFLSLRHGGTGNDNTRNPWHEVKDDRITQGFSGSALVHEMTGHAIGVINSSFSQQHSEGGLATPTASILKLFPELSGKQNVYKTKHPSAFWQLVQSPATQTIPTRRYIAGEFVEARAFQGRSKRLEQLKRYLIDTRDNILVQIHAPVGRGKSALAYHFVHQIKEKYKDSFMGIVVMSLREATANSFEASFLKLLRDIIPTERVKNFDAILQQPEQNGISKISQIFQQVPVDERVLVVLDNFEDALNASQEISQPYSIVIEMLQRGISSNSVHFLLTTREPLEPPSIDNLTSRSKRIKICGLQDEESIQLMHDLQDDDEDFKLEAVDNLSAILNTELQGLPLNIVTLASFLKSETWTLPRYLSQPELLEALKHNASQVLYESRNVEEQQIMQALAIFQKAVPLAALQFLLPELDNIQACCDRLEKHSVIVVAKDELGIPSSYSLRPVDAEYALKQIDDTRAMHSQAARYYVQDAAAVQDVLDAFAQWMHAKDYEAATDIRTDITISLYRLGNARESIPYLQQGLSIAQESNDRHAKEAYLGNLGNAYANLGEVQKAISYYQEALSIAQEIGNRHGEGTHLGNLGNAYANLGEVQQAISYYQQALSIAQEIGDRHGEGSQLGNLGNAYADLGEVQKGISYYQQALNIAQEIGDRHGEGSQLGNLGNAYADLGEVQKGISYYQQALNIAQEIGDRRAEGTALRNLGNAYADLGEVQKAMTYYQHALNIAQEIGDKRAEGTILGNLATPTKI